MPIPPGTLPNIEFLVENDGHITVGCLNRFIEGAAASDDHQCYAQLQRRDGETFGELLVRLDQAIEKAQDEGIMIDEINTPSR